MAVTEKRYFETGQATVSAAGTRVLVSTLFGNQAITILAAAGNTGNLYVGDQDMTSLNGLVLPPGASINISLNTSIQSNEYVKIFIDAATSGDKASWIRM